MKIRPARAAQAADGCVTVQSGRGVSVSAAHIRSSAAYLADTLRSAGTADDSGYYNMSGHTDTSEYRIGYNPTLETLGFGYVTQLDTDDPAPVRYYFIMVYDLLDHSCKQARFSFESDNKTYAFDADIDRDTYTKDTILDFFINDRTYDEESGNWIWKRTEDIAAAQVSSVCNMAVKQGFVAWDAMMKKSGIGINMGDLGFSSYEDGIYETPEEKAEREEQNNRQEEDNRKNEQEENNGSNGDGTVSVGTIFRDPKNNAIQYIVKKPDKDGPTVWVNKTSDRKYVEIPQYVTWNNVKFKVTGISSSAGGGKTALKTLVIPGNVTTIGKKAFAGCSKLTTIRIDATNLVSVKKKAFYNIGNNARFIIYGGDFNKVSSALRLRTNVDASFVKK